MAIVKVEVSVTSDQGFFAVKYAGVWYGFHESIFFMGPTIEFICEKVVEDTPEFTELPEHARIEVFGVSEPDVKQVIEVKKVSPEAPTVEQAGG